MRRWLAFICAVVLLSSCQLGTRDAISKAKATLTIDGVGYPIDSCVLWVNTGTTFYLNWYTAGIVPDPGNGNPIIASSDGAWFELYLINPEGFVSAKYPISSGGLGLDSGACSLYANGTETPIYPGSGSLDGGGLNVIVKGSEIIAHGGVVVTVSGSLHTILVDYEGPYTQEFL